MVTKPHFLITIIAIIFLSDGTAAQDYTRFFRVNYTWENERLYGDCTCPFTMNGCRTYENATVECENCEMKKFSSTGITLPLGDRVNFCCKRYWDSNVELMNVHEFVPYFNNSQIIRFSSTGCNYNTPNKTKLPTDLSGYLTINDFQKFRIKATASENPAVKVNITDKYANIWVRKYSSVNRARQLPSVLKVELDAFKVAAETNNTIKAFSVLNVSSDGTTGDITTYVYVDRVTNSTDSASVADGTSVKATASTSFSFRIP